MLTDAQRLSAAGFAATAVSFGPARMGFGLFVPEFQAAFSMSSTAVGLVSSLGFAGFLVGLLIAQVLLERRGPAIPVVSGLAAATLGIVTIVLAPGVWVLAPGVFLAASSAGFAWTPFNDAVHRKVREVDRKAALSEISTGTSAGIAVAGLIALGMAFAGFGWRLCWTIFAVGSALALLANWAVLRGIDKSQDPPPKHGWRALLRWPAAPLFVVAFVFGVTSAIYISFAADAFARAGVPGMPGGTTPALVFIFYGFFGLAGLATGRIRDRIGLAALLRLLMLAGAGSLACVALLSGGWPGLVLSAGLQGMNVMMTSAVLAIWSERLFPGCPSRAFTAALLATAAGNLSGPALAGLVVDGPGFAVMFLGAAVLPIVTAIALRARFVVDQPARFADGLTA
jgi:predicted MFS family arabinose efflux permease